MAWPNPPILILIFDSGVPSLFLSLLFFLLGSSAPYRAALHCTALHWRIGVDLITRVAICNRFLSIPWLTYMPRTAALDL